MGLHISKDLKDIYRSGWVNLNTDTLTVAIAYSDGKDNPAVVGQILVAAPSMLAALIATLEWIDKPEMHDALKLAVTNAINKATK